MLAMSLEMALANDTESVDLFTLLDETCPYWQVQYSKFYRQAQLHKKLTSFLRPFKDGSYGSQLHDDIVADKYKQGEPPKTDLPMVIKVPPGTVGLSINVQDNFKLDDKSQTLTLSGSYKLQWVDDRFG